MIIRLFIPLLLIIIFFSCNSNNKNSFDSLNQAFNNWYAKSHCKNIVLTNNGYDYSIYVFNNDLQKEYNNDLLKFKLELSQINPNKLNINNRISYHNIFGLDILQHSPGTI